MARIIVERTFSTPLMQDELEVGEKRMTLYNRLKARRIAEEREVADTKATNARPALVQ